jgi:DNA-binding IclR family transcriptional regulator
VYQNRGENAIKTDIEIGQRFGMHHTAAGKAILAHLPDDEIRTILDHRGQEKKTENTITDPDEMFEEVEKICERGYALNQGEGVSNVHAIATPVLTRRPEVVGSISIAGPRYRFNEERVEGELVPLLRGIQSELQINMDYI